jgi:hypothetical protein
LDTGAVAATSRGEYSMNLEVRWCEPVAMRRLRSIVYELDLGKVPESPGVYVFGRRWGDRFEALYVGKALNVRSRVKNQLNNLKLMSHVRDARSGARVLIAGEAVTKPGQRSAKAIELVERSLIRYFLSEGHDLVNVQGTRLRRHEITSTRRPMRFVPSLMYVDSGR